MSLDKESFNLDLSTYLEDRKKQYLPKRSFFSRREKNIISKPKNSFNIYNSLLSIFSKNNEEPIQIIEHSPKTQQESVLDAVDTEYPETESSEVFEDKTSFFSKIMAFFKTQEKDENLSLGEEITQEIMQQDPVTITKLHLYKPVVNDEIKSVFQMTSSIIRRLPEQEQLNLMKSKDYEIYLALMRRYNIK